MQEVMGSSPFTSIEKHRENAVSENLVFQKSSKMEKFLAGFDA
jgi:hypothetical protein